MTPSNEGSPRGAGGSEAVGRLATLIMVERDALLADWREKVRALPSAAHLDTPTLNDHVPALLVELAMALRARAKESIADVLLEGSPPVHGQQRFQDGFAIEEVVAEYNILRGCVHDLADRAEIALQGTPFHILNRVLDGAIGMAVQTYATQRVLEAQQRRLEHLTFVAHDLRTPLTAIALAAHYLERVHTGQPMPMDTARMLATLQRNVRNLRALVDQIMADDAGLDGNEAAALVRRQIDFWPLVESLLQDLQPLASTAGTRLINDVPDEFIVYADASKLRRVLQNLVANAIHYAPRGEVRVNAAELTGYGVECCVLDNGVGIPPERLGTLWNKLEPDSTSDVRHGLGLAIVKTYVEAHGGRVSVESTEGHGSCFRIHLPL